MFKKHTMQLYWALHHAMLAPKNRKTPAMLRWPAEKSKCHEPCICKDRSCSLSEINCLQKTQKKPWKITSFEKGQLKIIYK